MARRPRVRKKPCYECGRRVAVDVPSCPHCRAVQQTFCECGAHVSVHATACPLCEVDLVPRRFRQNRTWFGPVVVVALIGAALYGLYDFVERSGPQVQGEALEKVDIAFKRSDYADAERLIREYHSKFGAKRNTSLRLAQCLVHRGREEENVLLVEEGLLMLEEISRTDPADTETHHIRCDTYRRLGRWEEAEAAARSIVNLDPRDGAAHSLLAELAERRGDLAGAIESARRALDGRGAPGETRIRLAHYLMGSGRIGEALFAFAREAELGGERRAALDGILSVLTLYPDTDQKAQLRGRVALEADRESVEAALASDDFDPASLEQSVRLLLALGNPGTSREAIESAGNVRALSVFERLLLARARAAEGDRDRAVSLLSGVEGDLSGSAGGQESDTLRAEVAAAWLECRSPGRALDLLRGPESKTIPEPVRMRLTLRTRWWRLAAAAPGSGESIAAAFDILSIAIRLRALCPADDFGIRSENRIRTILARLEERLAGDVPGRVRPAPVLSPGGEVETVHALYRRRPGAVDRDTEARWVLRRALWVRDLRSEGESIPGFVDSGVGALRAGLMALVTDTATAANMARSEEFRESPLRDQCLAARILAGQGHLATAVELLERLDDADETEYSDLCRADLLRALDRIDAARKQYEAAAAKPGAQAALALMRLAEMTVEHGEAELGPLLQRIRSMPGK